MNIAQSSLDLVANATFKIHKKDGGCGQCVLIEDGLIITAAHCVDWNNTGYMALGANFMSQIASDVKAVAASVSALEPVSDVAILECPDSQDFYKESTAFDDFFEDVVPVKLSTIVPDKSKGFSIWVRTHLKTWVKGEAGYYGGNSTFGYKTDVEIINGTSGGPIVNESGELVGVVSQGTNTADSNGKFGSSAAFLPLALPTWVIARVRDYQKKF